MSKEWEPDDVFDVLASDTAREVLALASVRAVSADDLAEHCEVSLPTIYRRTNALVEYDLLAERTEIDDDGNHYKTFETALDRLCVEVEDGTLDVDVQITRDRVGQFEQFIDDLGPGTDGSDPDTDDSNGGHDGNGGGPR